MPNNNETKRITTDEINQMKLEVIELEKSFVQLCKNDESTRKEIISSSANLIKHLKKIIDLQSKQITGIIEDVNKEFIGQLEPSKILQ